MKVDEIFYALQTALQGILMILEVWLYIPLKVYQAHNNSTRSHGNGADRMKKTVVIVGGNFSGLSALWELQEQKQHGFNIVLIDQKEYFEYTPGVLRLFCEPSLFATLAKPLPVEDGSSSSLSHRVIRGKVTALTTEVDGRPRTVLTYDQDGSTKRLQYDYLILATGSTYSTQPIQASSEEDTLEEREKSWMLASNRLMSARSVLILGGGAVGIELAAEIADYYPGTKKVTIVDASSKLAPLFPPAAGDYARRWLRAKGVDLRLGEGVKTWNHRSCALEDGTVLFADMVYVCFGGRPNSSMVPVSQLDQRKNIVVMDTLQMKGSSPAGAAGCIFACGDVAAPPTEGVKQAFQAEIQGEVAANNVIRTDTGRRLLRYPVDVSGSDRMPLLFVLSLGRHDGVLGFNNLCLTGPLAALFKWILEYTKALQMSGRIFYRVLWKVADAAVLFLSRTVFRPAPRGSTVSLVKSQ